MAVAAYAALISLTHVLNNVHNRAQLGNILVDIKQIQHLQESVNYLVGFLEVSQTEDQRVEHLCWQISQSAFETEGIFDFHVVNQLWEGSDAGDERDFSEDLERLIEKVDLIKMEVLAVEEVLRDVRIGTQLKVSMPVGGSKSTSFGGKSLMVGFDKHLIYIMDELTKEKKLKTISITGMGGIGKTTLAKNVFDHPYIVNHFDMKIWVTISQEYNVEEIFMGLLNDGKVTRGGGNLPDLGQRVYQKLFSRKYLIVMDDVWSVEACNDFKRFFPDNGNGSRILITTRLANVATSLGSINPYSMSFLDEENSWKLFCQTIFGEEGCPFPELLEIGKTIAKSCRGLPLEITVIGGLLANNLTREFWESIAENVSSFGNSGYDEHCLKVLSLSYGNLPIHLKACFLYLRFYPEDCSIYPVDLIKRWIAEGFIKSGNDKSLEEIAMEYFKDLISRNLIFIREWGIAGEYYRCGVHDLLRDLCLRESDKEHFIRSPKVQRTRTHSSFHIYTEPSCHQCGEIRPCFELQNFVLISRLSSSHESPYVCGECIPMFLHQSKQRFVRLMTNGVDYKIVSHPTQLRYVLASGSGIKFILPSLLHILWNLQILEISVVRNDPLVLPIGIWKLPELRCLEMDKGCILPNPVDDDVEGKDFFILKNLQTLARIKNLKCTKDVLDRIPNLKTLEIGFEDEPGDNMEWMEWSMHLSVCNLAQLQTLEALEIQNSVVEGIIFPNSLKKLYLMRCKISWEGISIIGLLPNLERLQVSGSGEGSEWTPVEGEFLQLRLLSIHFNYDLVMWKADRIHFPMLEKLILSDLPFLEEIPLGIGDIETLRTIHVGGVSESVVESAKQILEEQECMGNDSLEIFVDFTKLGCDSNGQ